jgi:hypothetical protein
MSNGQEMCIRLMPHRDSQNSPGRHVDWSHRFDGHEERLVAHEQRIHSNPCPCGSGRTYGRCCLGRVNQEELELRQRRKQARQ